MMQLGSIALLKFTMTMNVCTKLHGNPSSDGKLLVVLEEMSGSHSNSSSGDHEYFTKKTCPKKLKNFMVVL